MLKTALGRFRLIGILEGISFLVLLLIAMPLKYYAGLLEVVTVVGMLHGLLFVLYVLAIVYITIVSRWKWVRVLGALIAAFVPFGPFVLDYRLRKEG